MFNEPIVGLSSRDNFSLITTHKPGLVQRVRIKEIIKICENKNNSAQVKLKYSKLKLKKRLIAHIHEILHPAESLCFPASVLFLSVTQSHLNTAAHTPQFSSL